MCERVFVRWDNLKFDREEGRRLPGYRDEAVVRRFKAPEAMDVNFYEVHAKSALNRVPEQSYVPFRWTINPYRGCTHACVFCMSPETPVLMADGTTRPIGSLRAGDRIVGTSREGNYRRYVETDVLDKWDTVKPAFRVTLEDGTELVASGDHRFLTNRGWKHVTGAERGPLQRAFLTTNNKLIGTGAYVQPPNETADYRRGYLCGLIRGDGHVGTYSHSRPGRSVDAHHRFRLALTDLEALRRARLYLDAAGVQTDEFDFSVAHLGARPMRAIRTSRRGRVDLIRGLVEWPRQASDAWCKGFLAGIFDAEGSCSKGILRIPNTDAAILDWTTWCLRRFAFDHAVEDRRLPNGIKSIRLRGGLRERLRFFHSTNPAITRKRTVQGTALRSDAQLRVLGIEDLGVEIPMCDITTGTGDFIANGVVSHNCFARPTHKYLDMNAGRDFEKEIVVKVNAPELVRAELGKPSWKFEHVALGTNTDPYQWVEAKYRLMPGIWEAMRDFANPCSVLTKSPLLLRDIELMKEVAERAPFMASLSIPTIDEKAWRQTEPHTPSPYARIEAVAELSRAGIDTGVLVAPVMPGVNDDPAQVERIIELCTEAGARHISGICLHLRQDVKDIWWEWLEAYRPDLIPRYRELYGTGKGAYAKPAERERIAGLVQRGKRKAGFVAPRGETHEEAAGRERPRDEAGREHPRDEAKRVRVGKVRPGPIRRWGGAPVQERQAPEEPLHAQDALF